RLPLGGKILAAFFHAVTPRTAGFNMLPMAELTAVTVVVTIVFMFIGGSPAGTAGGIKTTTLGLLLATVWATVRGDEEVVVLERRIPAATIGKALALVVIASGLVLGVTVLMLMVDGHP